MQKVDLNGLFDQTTQHRAEHNCGGYPYEHATVLSSLCAALKPKRILELGTALGYTAACMVYGFSDTHIETIDQDESHMAQAQSNWLHLGISKNITPLVGKAEAILLTRVPEYDLIFFDGYSPSMKFLIEFERILKKRGVLITANMFLKDPLGGKYMRELSREYRWRTSVFADTTLATKLF